MRQRIFITMAALLLAVLTGAVHTAWAQEDEGTAGDEVSTQSETTDDEQQNTDGVLDGTDAAEDESEDVSNAGDVDPTDTASDDPADTGSSGDADAGDDNVAANDDAATNDDTPEDLESGPDDGSAEGEAETSLTVRRSRGMMKGQLQALRARFGGDDDVSVRTRSGELAAEAEQTLGANATPQEIRAFFHARSAGYATVEEMRSDVEAILGADANRGLVKAYLSLRQAAARENGDFEDIRSFIAGLGDDVNPGRIRAWLKSKGHHGQDRGRRGDKREKRRDDENRPDDDVTDTETGADDPVDGVDAGAEVDDDVASNAASLTDVASRRDAGRDPDAADSPKGAERSSEVRMDVDVRMDAGARADIDNAGKGPADVAIDRTRAAAERVEKAREKAMEKLNNLEPGGSADGLVKAHGRVRADREVDPPEDE